MGLYIFICQGETNRWRKKQSTCLPGVLPSLYISICQEKSIGEKTDNLSTRVLTLGSSTQSYACVWAHVWTFLLTKLLYNYKCPYVCPSVRYIEWKTRSSRPLIKIFLCTSPLTRKNQGRFTIFCFSKNFSLYHWYLSIFYLFYHFVSII